MFEMLKEMWSDGWEGRLLVLLTILVLASIPAGVYVDIEEAREWKEFSAAHACKVVGQMQGTTNVGTGFGVTASGQTGMVVTTSSTPARTRFLCDDGVTYWR